MQVIIVSEACFDSYIASVNYGEKTSDEAVG